MNRTVAQVNARGQFPRAIGTTLTTRFASVASVLTLVFVLVVGGLSYYFTRMQIISGVEDHVENEAALHAERASSTLTSVVKTLSPLTKNSLILNSLMDSLTRETTLVPFLKDFSTISGLPVSIVFTDFEGLPIAGKRALALDQPGWKPSVLEKGEPFVEIREGTAGAILFIAEPVFVSRTLSPEGALIYEVRLEDVLSSGAIANPPGSQVRLIHRGMPEQVARTQTEATSASLASPLQTTRVLQVPKVLAPLDLAIEVSEDQEVVQAPLRRLLYTYIIASILLMAVGLLVSLLLARFLARPLRDLETVAASVVASGSYSHRFAVQGSAETAHLGDVFNRMLERLGSAHEELKQQAKEASLRNQELADTNAALKKEIAERRRAEIDAEKAQKVLLGAIQNMPDGFALVDEQEQLVLCNERYKELFPQIRDLIEPGASFSGLLKAAEKYERVATLVGQSGKPYSDLDTGTWQDGTTLEIRTSDDRWIEAREYPAPGIGRICIRIDVTKRKQAEQALHQAHQELEDAYRELRNFTYIVSHDLRAPLVNIKGFSSELGLTLAEIQQVVEPLLAKAPNVQRQRLNTLMSEDVPEATRFIEESVSKIDHQINTVLTLSRVGHREFNATAVDMKQLVAEALASQAHRIETAGVEIEVEPLPTVMTDRVAMEQIIGNLLDNALKYLDPTRPGRISVSVEHRPGETAFHIRDNGVGIAPGDVKRVFQIFRRVGSNKTAGEGVGLSYVQANVRRLGGHIHCRSEVGVGSVFTLSVPHVPPTDNLSLSSVDPVSSRESVLSDMPQKVTSSAFGNPAVKLGDRTSQ